MSPTIPDMQTDPELLALIEATRKLPPMTREQIEAQRRSWVIGELMLQHESMSLAEASALYDAHATGIAPPLTTEKAETK